MGRFDTPVTEQIQEEGMRSGRTDTQFGFLFIFGDFSRRNDPPDQDHLVIETLVYPLSFYSYLVKKTIQ